MLVLICEAASYAELLALVPFTPGGLGFVEAGLVGTLTLAGVPVHAALTATLVYRLVAYWLPLLVGGVAYVLFRMRYRDVRGSRNGSAASPIRSEDAEAIVESTNAQTGR